MHKEPNLVYLAHRRHMHTIGQVFKYLHELTPPNVCRQTQRTDTGRVMITRSTTINVLAVPQLRLETSRKAVKYRGPFLYNLNDADTSNIDGWISFKSVLMVSDMFQVL